MTTEKEVGPFVVERQLGSGAMGFVYLARFKDKPNQRVALKFVGTTGVAPSQKALDRFEREGEILKQLKHPNIVRIIGHGRHQKKYPYYAMEYVDGSTLSDVLVKRGRLPWEEVVKLGKQLCAALQHAHEMGIIHRDIKPSNLMVLSDGTLKLTDFGIAKDLDLTQLTATDCTVGTSSYMSPEQCKGSNITHKSDLYSLGVVLYELLTGQRPFEAESVMDMFMLHVQGKFERPSRIVLDIPPWLDTLVCQLLEKKPEKRPFDAAVVRAALDQVVEKVTAQQSAGVDALTGGTITGARLSSRTMAAEDKTAARTLAQGLGKGKKKRKKPFFKRLWVQAVGIVLAMAAVGLLMWAAFQPPNPDRLHREAKRLMESGDPAKRDLARDDAIAKYLKYHRKRMDGTDQLKDIQGWADQVDTERRERSLINRMKTGITSDSSVESAARQAIELEEKGEFNDAEEKWKSLSKYDTDEGGHGDRMMSLVATKRLADLAKVKTRLLEIRQKVDAILDGQDRKPDSESEELAIRAVRYERFEDAALAARTWQSVKSKNEKEGGDHIWLLLAARQAKEQKDKAPPASEEKSERLEHVKQYRKSANDMARQDKSAAKRMLNELVFLYDDRSEVQEEVDQAKKDLDKLRRP